MAIEELQNGRYRHLRPLGSGGMGEVYLMQDTRVNRQVAIKVLRAEDALYRGDEKAANSARLFEREARAIAALDHPNILPLYDFGEEVRDDITMTYMVMPYCADGSLEAWLRLRGNELLAPQDVAALIEQAAEGLQYAHEQKIIHLDVKPSNFLMRNNRKNPQQPTLLLADFGIARHFTTVSSSSRTIRGTPTAMSPEQWSGEPVFASDQYSLAVMAYEMFVGRPPFTGSLEQLMYRHFSVPAPSPSTFHSLLPATIDSVLLRALNKKPEERYPSIAEFASALTQAVGNLPGYTGGEIVKYSTLAVSQSEAQAGISRMLTLASGEEVTVSVPAGAQDGQVLQVPGPASSSEQAGVIMVNIAIQQASTRSSSVERGASTPELLPPPPPTIREARAESALQSSPQQVLLPSPVPVSASAHDLPTVMSLGNIAQVTAAPEPLTSPPRPRRRLSLLALISLLVVLVLAGSVYVLASHQFFGGAQPTHASGAQLTQTPASKAQPTLTPTSAPGLYIAGSYNGSMQDNNTGQFTHLSVYIAQNNGSGALTGDVTFNSSSQQNYPLHGTVDLQGNFSFTVQQPSGQLPFIFYGATQNQVYLHGDYCRATATPCQPAGFFTVGPRYTA